MAVITDNDALKAMSLHCRTNRESQIMDRQSVTRASFQRFNETLNKDGVREALAFLLGLTDYRFIGIWRFNDGHANAAVHVDRENPSVMRSQEVPDSATYCCYVRDSKGVFMTAHAMLDPKTEGHPARESVPAYWGVPVMDPEGNVLGTLCHYDLVPRDPEQVDIDLMIQVASTLARGKHLPPYPTPSLP
jgi:GAF domain-containing protein